MKNQVNDLKLIYFLNSELNFDPFFVVIMNFEEFRVLTRSIFNEENFYSLDSQL